MRDENQHDDVVMSEDTDRRFHELIAAATQSSGIVLAEQTLWDARTRSPQSRSIDEHQAILRALKRRDPESARAAMREHLAHV
jgi:GntR family transcriptional repressor for pyruvate dehydrogenase complex